MHEYADGLLRSLREAESRSYCCYCLDNGTILSISDHNANVY